MSEPNLSFFIGAVAELPPGDGKQSEYGKCVSIIGEISQ